MTGYEDDGRSSWERDAELLDERPRSTFGSTSTSSSRSWAPEDLATSPPNGSSLPDTSEHRARTRFDFGIPGDTFAGDDRPSLFTRTDGQALLYANAVNLFAGEPSSCKSWMAQALARDLINGGEPVIYLDYEATYRALLRRLGALGARDGALEAFFYAKTLGKLAARDIDELADFARIVGAPLIVIDGVAEALAAHGIKEESAGDYAVWHANVPRALVQSTGACVLLIDHVPKPAQSSDRKRKGDHADLYPRGSGHKIAALDGAAYMLTAVDPFSRTTTGVVDFTIAKDREGYVGPKRARAARVTLTAFDVGRTVELKIATPPARTREEEEDEGGRAPAELSEAFTRDVVDAVDRAARRERGPVTARTVIDELRAGGVKFRDGLVGPGLIKAEAKGLVVQSDGPGRSKLYAPPPKQERMPL